MRLKKLIIDRTKWLRTKPGTPDTRQPANRGDCGCFGSYVRGEHDCGTYGAQVPGVFCDNPSLGIRGRPASIMEVNDYPGECGIKTARQQESALRRAARLLGYSVKFVGRGHPSQEARDAW